VIVAAHFANSGFHVLQFFKRHGLGISREDDYEGASALSYIGFVNVSRQERRCRVARPRATLDILWHFQLQVYREIRDPVGGVCELRATVSSFESARREAETLLVQT
jgi:hypothetical protein